MLNKTTQDCKCDLYSERYNRMIVKYGEEQHLLNLMTKWQIFFNLCKYFRDLEEKQLKKGIADQNDGGISASSVKVIVETNDGTVYNNTSMDFVFIVNHCLKTPIFCMKKTISEIITARERIKLRDQFPNHTHALIIEDEDAFLENIRYNFRNKAFSHVIFYQNEFLTDITDFLINGKSNTRFYEPKKSQDIMQKLLWT